MAGSVNKVILVGNVGKDPEVRSTQGGMKIANLTMATSEDWTDKASGERKSRTEWHRVSVMNDRIVDVVEKYVRKGSKIYVEGALQTRKWTDNQGQERYTTEIMVGRFNGSLVLLDSKRQDDAPDERPTQAHRRAAATPSWDGQRPAPDDIGDSIPF
jgi:single-strand DNA-binding protein